MKTEISLFFAIFHFIAVKSQLTTCLDDKCGTNNKIVDTVNEKLIDWTNTMNNVNSMCAKEVSKIEDKLTNVKVNEDATNEIKQQLDKLKQQFDAIEIPVKYVERCTNDSSITDTYNKPCDRGWIKIQNRCFITPYKVNILATSAHEWCQTEYGARLAIIDTQELFTELKQNFDVGDNCFWVAAFKQSGNKWYWSDCTSDIYGTETCSRREVNGTMWRNENPRYSSHDRPFGYNYAHLPGLSIPDFYQYSSNSVFACISRVGLINRDNQVRAVLCEYSL